LISVAFKMLCLPRNCAL